MAGQDPGQERELAKLLAHDWIFVGKNYIYLWILI